jgi:hypothetical protein
MPAPRSNAPSELVPWLIDIVSVEGPVLSRRVFRLYAQAAGTQLRQNVASILSTALRQAIHEGHLVAEDTWGVDGELQQVLRTPAQLPVVLRNGGDRSINEIPLTEIVAAITFVKHQRGLTLKDEILRACLSLFGLERRTANARQVFEAAWQRLLDLNNSEADHA